MKRYLHIRKLVVLRRRDFRLLYAASAVSFVGNVFTVVALAFGVLSVTHSVTAVGLVIAARQATQAAFLLMGGVWGDRISRRTMICWCYSAAAVTQGIMATLLLSHVGSVAALAGVSALNGAVMAFLAPAWGGIVPAIVPTQELQQANALFSVTRNTANISGAIVAGALIATLGAGWALLADAGSFLVGAALVAAASPLPANPNRSGILQELRVGWVETVSRTWVWVIILQFTVFNMAYTAAFDVYAPVVAKLDLGGAHAYGVLVAGMGIGAVIGGALMLGRQPRRPMLIASVAVGFAIPVFAFLALAQPLPVLVVAGALSGGCLEIFAVLWASTLQAQIPTERLSRVLAYDSLGALAFAPVGSGLAGPLASLVGDVHTALWITVCVMAVPTIAVLGVPAIWRLSGRTTGQPAPRLAEA